MSPRFFGPAATRVVNREAKGGAERRHRRYDGGAVRAQRYSTTGLRRPFWLPSGDAANVGKFRGPEKEEVHSLFLHDSHIRE